MDIPRMISSGLDLAKELLDPDKRAKRKQQAIEGELEDLNNEKRALMARLLEKPDPALELRLGVVIKRIIELRPKK